MSAIFMIWRYHAYKKNPLGNTVACPGIGIAMLVVFLPIPGQKIQKMSRRDKNIVDE